MLGGTGAAISKLSPHPTEAIAYAKWLVSPEHQRGTYFREGGQPASLSAWTDSSVNAMADGFFAGTLQTLQTAYLRPRFDGFVRFFEAAGIEINRCLRFADLDANALSDVRVSHGAGEGFPDRTKGAAGTAAHRVDAADLPACDPRDLLYDGLGDGDLAVVGL